MIDKYRDELKEILDEIIKSDPQMYSVTGETKLFNWRSIFDFSSEAWAELDCKSRYLIVHALAEKRTLFIALLTFTTLYNLLERPDIASAGGLSLARLMEEITKPEYKMIHEREELKMG